jgi:hypothetical protein
VPRASWDPLSREEGLEYRDHRRRVGRLAYFDSRIAVARTEALEESVAHYCSSPAAAGAGEAAAAVEVEVVRLLAGTGAPAALESRCCLSAAG